MIVEDEVLVAMNLEDLLLEMGHLVIGPAVRIDEALLLAEETDLDFAILDVNLAGEPSFPVADILRRRGVPFVFATGYGQGGVDARFNGQPTLSKPYAFAELEVAIQNGLQEPTATSIITPT